jgi:hypothetical protein
LGALGTVEHPFKVKAGQGIAGVKPDQRGESGHRAGVAGLLIRNPHIRVRHAEAGHPHFEAALRKTMSDRGVVQFLAEVGAEGSTSDDRGIVQGNKALLGGH